MAAPASAIRGRDGDDRGPRPTASTGANVAYGAPVMVWLAGRVSSVQFQDPQIRGGPHHHGTAGRKRLLHQLGHLRRAVRDEGPPRAGEQLAEGTHRLKLLREPGAAGLLTARRGAP